jgi:hypothetical protein
VSSPYDWNDLDRAIQAACKSTAALPEVFRQFIEGELCALMPYHPELEGADLQIKNGSPFQFVRLRAEKRDEVSFGHVDETNHHCIAALLKEATPYCTALDFERYQ